MKQKKDIEETYQREDVARVFDADRKKYLFQRYKHKIEANFLKKTTFQLNKSKVKVLDVACGTGRMLPEMFKTGKDIEYHGLDSSNAMTSHLKKKAKSLGIDVNLKMGDATKLPYEDNSFDVVYTYHLTWHLPYELQKKMIREMIRVCKKDGYVVFDVLNENFIWEKFKDIFKLKKTDGIYKVNINDLKKLIGKHEYDIEKLSDFPIKNSVLYSFFNVFNVLRNFLPINLYHMIYFRVKK